MLYFFIVEINVESVNFIQMSKKCKSVIMMMMMEDN